MGVTFIVALGSNLTDLCGRTPLASCKRAIDSVMATVGGELIAVSAWYRTQAQPVSSQPDYINGAMVLQSNISPSEMLSALQSVESAAGRVRTTRNAARVLDLDILAVDEISIESDTLTVPHPRMAERAFVLYPLCDVAPGWRHPALGLTALELRDRVAGQRIARVADA